MICQFTIPVEKMLVYDDVDEDVLQCYHEMSLANLIFHAMKEGACSEQSSRMTAMDAASKNAGNVDIIVFYYGVILLWQIEDIFRVKTFIVSSLHIEVVNY